VALQIHSAKPAKLHIGKGRYQSWRRALDLAVGELAGKFCGNRAEDIRAAGGRGHDLVTIGAGGVLVAVLANVVADCP